MATLDPPPQLAAPLQECPAEESMTKLRILLFAYACHPTKSMESRIGWNRAILAGKRFDVTVLYGEDVSLEELQQSLQNCKWKESIRFLHVPHAPVFKKLIQCNGAFYFCYARWQNRAYRVALKLFEAKPFDLVHQVTFCGYREPGHGWKLPSQFLWGPVGGTQNFPTAFCSDLSWMGAIKERFRNIVNLSQMKWSRQVRNAARSARKIFTANSTGQSDLQKHLGKPSEVQLEIGIDEAWLCEKEVRDASEPLRILWAGRLKPWKSLPLLLRGLANLPASMNYSVRVLGVGECQSRWQRLAKDLGIADRIEWVGWPHYEASKAHYQWADVFAFTSMRDTSGTGILEALATSTPIVGVSHQGLVDIITSDCGIPIEVAHQDKVVQGFRDAILHLAADRSELQRLSAGALLRAQDFTWAQLGAQMDRSYAAVESEIRLAKLNTKTSWVKQLATERF